MLALGGLPASPARLFGGRRRGGLDQLVVAMNECRLASRVREIRLAATAAAQRFLDFDRVYLLTFAPARGEIWLRANIDFARCGSSTLRILASSGELALLHAALAAPRRITREESGSGGLLATLGSDECLVVALCTDQEMPSLLVMDRALSGRPIPDADAEAVRALAATTSLLIENLLLKKRGRRAQNFALTDPLTRLFNRGVGIAALEKEMAKAHRSGTPLTVLMLDLDNFKRLNDQKGHVVGDLALRRTADVLRKTIRKGDIVCRYGGEEFLCVLPATTVEEASISATRLFTAVEEEGERLALPLTISIGLAALRAEDIDAEALLTRADHALYASKAMGRNRFSVDG